MARREKNQDQKKKILFKPTGACAREKPCSSATGDRAGRLRTMRARAFACKKNVKKRLNIKKYYSHGSDLQATRTGEGVLIQRKARQIGKGVDVCVEVGEAVLDL